MTALLEPLDCECDEEEEFEPRLYSELPPEIQKLAVKEWQNTHYFPDDSCDCELITESSVETLEYEFGIDVRQQTYTGNKGKTYQQPEICWGEYRRDTSFVADINIEKLIAHGIEGCEYFSEDAKQLATSLGMAKVMNAAFHSAGDYEPDWTYKMEGRHSEVECDCYNCGLTETQQEAYYKLADKIRGTLDEIYKAACYRIHEVIEGEKEYHNSEECIVETFHNNDYKFNEEGEIV